MKADTLDDKSEKLIRWFQECENVLVAFSGGIDSSLLASAAFRAIGERASAVFFESFSSTPGETERAEKIASEIGIFLEIVKGTEFSDPDFLRNDEKRCYFCKKKRFSHLLDLVPVSGKMTFVEGSNADDLSTYRPGKKAAEESGVQSPLAQIGFSKSEVRNLARCWGLSNWELPSEPCLMTRIEYGIKPTPTILECIRDAENFLKGHSFSPVRVRYHHGNLARIEISKDQFPKLMASPFHEQLLVFFQNLGFHHITLELQGFRSGSMDNGIQK